MRTDQARNDPGQYDELAASWWDPHGPLAMLQWIAAARSEHIPPPRRPGAVLLDIACGGGLMAPHTAGYRHIGVDLGERGLTVAREHGVVPVRADARALPIATAAVDVVVAGEVLEHVPDLPAVVAELGRVLAPGGTLVIDTIADTALARFVAVTLAERIPGGPPAGLHDPALFVDRRQLVRLCAEHGVEIELYGLRPSLIGYAGWVLRRRPAVRMVRTRSTAILFGAHGRKASAN